MSRLRPAFIHFDAEKYSHCLNTTLERNITMTRLVSIMIAVGLVVCVTCSFSCATIPDHVSKSSLPTLVVAKDGTSANKPEQKHEPAPASTVTSTAADSNATVTNNLPQSKKTEPRYNGKVETAVPGVFPEEFNPDIEEAKQIWMLLEQVKVSKSPDSLSKPLQEAFIAFANSRKAYYEYTPTAVKLTREAIEQTNCIAWWMFIVVNIFLLIAVGVAAFEFWCSWQTKEESKTLATEAKEAALAASQTPAAGNAKQVMDFSLKKGELSVKTSRTGVAMLVLAMVLYFLFIKLVYPIEVIGVVAK